MRIAALITDKPRMVHRKKRHRRTAEESNPDILVTTVAGQVKS